MKITPEEFGRRVMDRATANDTGEHIEVMLASADTIRHVLASFRADGYEDVPDDDAADAILASIAEVARERLTPNSEAREP